MLPFIFDLLESGWISLLDYLAAHVILCLIPAFFIAGALTALVPKTTITRFLGPKASRWLSYPAAALGGFVLAVCSCTILPLFAGIWKRGAGLGPAVTFLFVGPAINILAISYTGAAIGMDIAIARILLSIVFGIGIGLIMAMFFRQEDTVADESLFVSQDRMRSIVWIFLGLLVAILISGTLRIDMLTRTYFSISIPLDVSNGLLTFLSGIHLSLQGGMIILLLSLLGIFTWRGSTRVSAGSTLWMGSILGLVIVTLIIAAPEITDSDAVVVNFTGRTISIAGLILATGAVARYGLYQQELTDWLGETINFVKQIFPLLILGIFLAGMFKQIIPEDWVRTMAGSNTLLANFVGVVFGVFMYFPTLVEVPIARMFLDLGMHRGPMLAYLIADPGLSIQSIMVTGQILGRKRTAVYVFLVSIFSTLAGYIFGIGLSLLG